MPKANALSKLQRQLQNCPVDYKQRVDPSVVSRSKAFSDYNSSNQRDTSKYRNNFDWGQALSKVGDVDTIVESTYDLPKMDTLKEYCG